VENLKRNVLAPVLVGVSAAGLFRLAGVASALTLLTFALTAFTAATLTVDFARATRARLRMGERLLPAMGGLLVRHNRRYGGFVIHFGILVVALGVMGSHAWSVQTETTLKRGESTELAGYTVRFDGLAAREESNHFKVIGAFTVSNHRPNLAVLQPSKKFYPQEQSPIAGVDYRLGLKEDVYLVLGDFARDGSHATIKLQINRLVSWIWIGGAIITLGTVLAILPERRRAA
jgi:cytochrome c-type biogenesis protein CcmF